MTAITRNLNAVTLVRVSTKKQGGEDRFGMDAQRSSNARYVAANGFIVKKTVEYADVSGDAVMYTPEMRDLQAFLRTPEMKGGNLVAKELSRLLRPTFNAYPLLQVFADQQISIHLPQSVLRLWTPEGRMLAGVMCANDINEAERIRDRCMAGREEARLRGYCAAGGETLPTGFLWDGKTKTYSADPLYMPNVLEAFHMVDKGETNLQFIIDKLHFCLRPPKGKRPTLAQPSGLKRILVNRLFIGERVYDKKFDLSVPKDQLMRVDGDGNFHKRQRPMIAREPNEVIVVKLPMEPAVDPALFERVQAILHAKSDKRHQSHMLHQRREVNTYRGLLFCAGCGAPIYTVATAKYQGYRCRDRFTSRGGTRKCTTCSMKGKVLERRIDWYFTERFRKDWLKEVLQLGRSDKNRIEAERRTARLQARQDQLQKKRDRIIDAQIDGTITKPDRDRRLKAIDEDLAANRASLDDATYVPTLSRDEWREAMSPFQDFAALPPDRKRALLSQRFRDIRVKDYCVVSAVLIVPYPDEIKLAKRIRSPREANEMNCHACGAALTEADLDRNQADGVSGAGRFCTECLDCTREERQAREYKRFKNQTGVLVAGQSGIDSFQRL